MGISREEALKNPAIKRAMEHYENNYTRSHTVIQKHKDDSQRAPNHRSQKTETYGGNSGPYAIAFNFFISDKRKRDLDGAVTTLLDCMVEAGVIEDDNRFVVKRLSVNCRDCKKGEERVEIIMEKLQ